MHSKLDIVEQGVCKSIPSSTVGGIKGIQTSQLSLFGSETQDFERNLKVSLQSHQISLFHKNISRFQAKSQDFSLQPQILSINSLHTFSFWFAFSCDRSSA